MNRLATRKQLLIAESELNREQLVMELAALTMNVRAFSHRAKSLGSIASAIAVLMAGLAAFRRGKPADPGAKFSWLQTIFRGAGLVSTFWLAFRAKDSEKSQ